VQAVKAGKLEDRYENALGALLNQRSAARAVTNGRETARYRAVNRQQTRSPSLVLIRRSAADYYVAQGEDGNVVVSVASRLA
jgi:hypothetical protein